jgi:hypothetical protein
MAEVAAVGGGDRIAAAVGAEEEVTLPRRCAG